MKAAGLSIVGLSLALTAWAAAQSGAGRAPAPAPGRPSAATTQKAAMPTPPVVRAVPAMERTVGGVAAPDKQVALNAPFDAIVRKVLVEEGALVTEGQVVAEMDDSVQKLAVAQARLQAEADSELRQAKLVFEETKITVERVEQTWRDGAAPEWEVRRERLRRDQAEAAVDTAKEKQAIARANLALEEERLGHFKVKAPFSGRIFRVNTESGASMTNRDPLLSMVAVNPLKAQVYLPMHLYDKIKLGQSYRLKAGDPVSRELIGKCKVIDPMMDMASRSFRCTFTIDNPDMKLPAGFEVDLVWPQ